MAKFENESSAKIKRKMKLRKKWNFIFYWAELITNRIYNTSSIETRLSQQESLCVCLCAYDD